MKTPSFRIALAALALLSCNYVTQMVNPITPTPLPTLTPPPPLSTPTLESSLAPAFIPAECVGTPLATVSPEQALAQPTITFEPNVEISKGTQLGIIRELSNIVEDVYVYPDFNGKDWEGIVATYRAKIEAGLDTETFYIEMQNMIAELEDEHSFFLDPLAVKASEAELRGENNYVGVGVYSTFDPTSGVYSVISTFPGSPAEHAGILSHDRIISVDGVPLDADTNISRLRGPQCSAVTLTVQSPNQEPRELLLVRAPITGELRIDARLVPTTDGSKIGYIFIPTFFDETMPPQIDEALEAFGKLDGLILDLRLNGGGSSSVVEPIMERFIDGKLGEFVSRKEKRTMEVNADPIHNSLTVPLIIIVSEDTVSYGEIFSGVMRDAGRAKIVGQTSFGNVEVLHGYNFDDGSQIWIASETFYSAFSDANWELTGIIPDDPTFAEWHTFTFETDPSVLAAVALLGHK